MKTFGEKVRERRSVLGLSQSELAEKAGIGSRTVTGYEADVRTPRPEQLYKIAKALKVSPDYLTDTSVDDPSYGIEHMDYVEEARKSSGAKTAMDLDCMLKENLAMFAGGEISFAAKQAYFEAIMDAFVDCKRIASEKFSRKDI